MTPRYGSLLSRTLLKTALEVAWLDLGDAVFANDFDHVRSAVLGEPRDGFVMMAKRGVPSDESVTLTYNTLADGDGPMHLGVVASYFGVILATDSALPVPPVDVTTEASVLTFTRTDLVAA